MRTKRRHRAHHVLLGRDPVRRVLITAAVACAALTFYFGWTGILASRYLAPNAPHPDDVASMGFLMATFVLGGISLVHSADQPAGLRRLRSSKRWLRLMRRKI